MSSAVKDAGKAVANGSLKGGLAGRNNSTSTLAEAAKKVASSKKPPELKLPPTKRPDMTAIELLKLQKAEALERDHEIAGPVGQWMKNDSLPTLDEIAEMVNSLGQDVLDLVAGEDNDGQEMTFGQQQQQYRELNESYLEAAFPIGEKAGGKGAFMLPAMETRRAAHMALLKHRFSKAVDRDQLLELVNLCVKENYFFDNQEGYIRVWQRRYMLSDSPSFGGLGEDDERLIAEIIGHHVSRLNASYKDDVREQAEELCKKGDIELSQLLAGKAGKCFVHAPSEMRGSFKLSEVFLLVEGDGDDRAFILEAVGPDKNNAMAIKDGKLFLWLPTLEVPRPPRIETLVNKGFSEDDSKLLQAFWGYLDRARHVQAERERRECEKEQAEQRRLQVEQRKLEEEAELKKAFSATAELKEEYAKETTISLDRIVLEMEPLEGTFYGEFLQEWKNPKGIANAPKKGLLFFLGEQKVVDGKPMIRVKKAPDWLTDGKFFTQANMEFASYGEFFRGLEQPLQGLMKALYSQEKNRAQCA